MTRYASNAAAYLFSGLICFSIIFSCSLAATSDEVVISAGTGGGSSNKKVPSGKSSLVILSETDWEQVLIGEWMVEL